MKLLTFWDGAELRVGVLDADEHTVRDLSARLPAGVGVRQLIERWEELGSGLNTGLAALPGRALRELRIAAPIPEPRRNVFCVGKNYSQHVVEFGRSGYDQPDRSEAMPEFPVVFSKATTSVTGPYDDIEPHADVTNELDYEAELGVIIGRGGRRISRDSAFEHVWGYTIIDDFTARDLQRKHKQWLLGKGLDTHCPMGPYAVTADEIPDVTALQVESWVNGERRQAGTVKDLIFDIPELIATISAGITLLPGDIIATGTPAGVGIGFEPPKFMVSGDVIEVAITGLGRQRNRVA
jgi:2-keto-4-pentenoate hydratase/2-oxohepta-3-ene-1,7-dioic acid hydratase in catechol pathway